ncbi:hypothetical protein [Leifsonia sp. fls2-241-R2A-40a]|uniref:hypothetical protein n=1 Tax=Leifsonia sp. fls2-241-R2A-40a TaxID=3040290 RepID=UPI00254BA399|nr:hypothetical protein [Leifsonia sp. fls2-241-R2A-40a]
MRVITTQGRPARVKPGRLDRHARRAFLLGNCLSLAFVLSVETGWPIVALRGRELTPSGTRFLAHAFVQHPDGWLVDIEGAHRPNLTREWQFETELVEMTTQEAQEELCSGWLDFPPQHHELAVSLIDPVLSLARKHLAAA